MIAELKAVSVSRLNVVFELAGLRIPPGMHLSGEIRDQIATGRYERPELAAVLAKLKTDDVVMELGSGIGVLSAYCARVVGSSNVFTFEANPALEAPIRNLYRENDVSPTLEICVLGDSHGEARLYVHNAFWASSTAESQASASSSTVAVAVRPFEEARRAVNPTFLIIDIEGGELDLLPALRFDGVQTIVIELHPGVIGDEGCADVLTTIEDAGFGFESSASSEDVFVFTRARLAGPCAEHATDYLSEPQKVRATQEICAIVPPQASFVLVDSGLWWQGGEFGDRKRRFLHEHDGVDWGLPSDVEVALGELRRRRSEGAEFLVFAWPAFWWFEDLPGLRPALELDFARSLENRRLVVFKLAG